MKISKKSVLSEPYREVIHMVDGHAHARIFFDTIYELKVPLHRIIEDRLRSLIHVKLERKADRPSR